jgi:hypothetical protein
MALTIRREALVQVLAGWHTIRRELFIKSEAYGLLREELQRHLDHEIMGRSFLIAGHRGAGKTMLVQTVIDDIRNEIFAVAEQRGAIWRPGAGGQETPILQRPLLVKLHGPSLLGAGTVARPDAAAAPPEPRPDVAPSAVQVTINTPGSSPEPAKPPGPPDPPDPIKSALVQITIALYRALSTEFSSGYTFAAQQGIAERSGRLATGDLPELPARCFA